MSPVTGNLSVRTPTELVSAPYSCAWGWAHPVDPEDLQEFKQLAISAGALPVATVTGRRDRPDPRYFMGSGKAEELREVAHAQAAEVILVDHALSPSQERNLEKLIERRVLDRNGLILDIFAQRARSFEGKLEVELAQLKHIASRLVRGWTHLERQKGGIGLRGPGETQLESDRRIIGQRVRVLTKRLEKIRQQRETGPADARRDPGALARPGRLHQRRQVHAVSARSRAPMPMWPISCSPRSTRPYGDCSCRAVRRWWPLTRWASSAICRTSWWPRSNRR